ncbi:MAG: FAD-dependent thymidylate synthase [Symbiobacteriaceae bacterium]|nr:FAD-dependent thymidylate synthase [Symbiobacteriaceae bacterium]
MSPQVILLEHTPNPEWVVAAAARLCYSASGVEDILERLTPERARTLVEQLLARGHESPIEHISFTFAIEGISRACSHQLVRHRIASYSQQSQRYVSMEQFAYITPPTIAAQEEALAVFQEQMVAAQAAYDRLTAMGVAQEDARFVLPNACETKLIMTMNARSLHNFFALRLCQRAQWEIRVLGEKMLELVQPLAPSIFAHAGPSCVREGICHEGAYSCGRLTTNHA